jgi:hypothetical protein
MDSGQALSGREAQGDTWLMGRAVESRNPPLFDPGLPGKSPSRRKGMQKSEQKKAKDGVQPSCLTPIYKKSHMVARRKRSYAFALKNPTCPINGVRFWHPIKSPSNPRIPPGE